MRTCTDDSKYTESSVLVLGMFDGVHLGHQALMQKARALADQWEIPMVVMTFDSHPLSLIAPVMTPHMLTTPEQRLQLLKEQGADIVCSTPFTPEVRDMAPEIFVEQMVSRWHPKAVVVGFNYHFGKHGAGTPALLKALGATDDFETVVVPEVRVDGEAVSSTRIRKLLAEDDLAGAERLLGHPYQG